MHPAARISLLIAAVLLTTGCPSTRTAVRTAAKQMQCEPERIKVIEEDATGAVLDVCGKRQLWMLDFGSNYNYAGPVPTAPRDQAQTD